ncbi:MAG TPA: GNAT family N-acetyltransferase [Rhodocyclaceae bacterium]|nr:GNAT family N-acetyltransferase [Rhodocyclaceae bacterium]
MYTSVDIVEYRVETGEWPALATAARLIREAVFIREQGISADEEWDEHDNGGLHTVAYGPDDEPVGTGRLLPDGRIGRMAVLPAWRGKGVGGALLERLMASAKQGGTSALHLHAQTPRIGFYQRHGFEVQGAPFLEVGIPHVRMIRSD